MGAGMMVTGQHDDYYIEEHEGQYDQSFRSERGAD